MDRGGGATGQPKERSLDSISAWFAYQRRSWRKLWVGTVIAIALGMLVLVAYHYLHGASGLYGIQAHSPPSTAQPALYIFLRYYNILRLIPILLPAACIVHILVMQVHYFLRLLPPPEMLLAVGERRWLKRLKLLAFVQPLAAVLAIAVIAQLLGTLIGFWYVVQAREVMQSENVPPFDLASSFVQAMTGKIAFAYYAPAICAALGNSIVCIIAAAQHKQPQIMLLLPSLVYITYWIYLSTLRGYRLYSALEFSSENVFPFLTVLIIIGAFLIASSWKHMKD